jgi:NadR type nicotinamide-nucleotide adenylyltransferase
VNVKRFHRSLVIGKFYPPHRGHHLLINSAVEDSDEVYVMVCHKPEQSIPGNLRAAWLREVHPEAHVLEVDDTLGDDDTAAWAEFTLRFLGFIPDAVFSSEDYGPRYAAAMGCAHVSVDLYREKVPCSGTMIRKNPFKYIDFLEPCVRAYFIKRVCFVGAESTGKTTLAQALAEHYGEPWMPEYGREYCEQKYGPSPFVDEKETLVLDDWKSEEFLEIATEHARREDALAREARRLLVVDTDSFATSIWHERYLGSQSPELESIADERKSRYSLYILCDIDIPWVQDGTRDGQKTRMGMHKRFIEKLSQTNRTWITVSGRVEHRIDASVAAIDILLSQTQA